MSRLGSTIVYHADRSSESRCAATDVASYFLAYRGSRAEPRENLTLADVVYVGPDRGIAGTYGIRVAAGDRQSIAATRSTVGPIASGCAKRPVIGRVRAFCPDVRLADRPVWLYRLSQGLHVGLAAADPAPATMSRRGALALVGSGVLLTALISSA